MSLFHCIEWIVFIWKGSVRILQGNVFFLFYFSCSRRSFSPMWWLDASSNDEKQVVSLNCNRRSIWIDETTHNEKLKTVLIFEKVSRSLWKWRLDVRMLKNYRASLQRTKRKTSFLFPFYSPFSFSRILG